MTQKNNWKAYKEVIDSHHIDCLYHFTDRENLESIIQNGGLYSWADCEEKGITIAKPGGSSTSRSLDSRDNLEHYVRVSFVKQHPMMFVAMNDNRISNPVVLKNRPQGNLAGRHQVCRPECHQKRRAGWQRTRRLETNTFCSR